MTSEILKKLANELSDGIDTEAKVIYLLVEINKVREEIRNQSRHGSNPKTFIDFYRDWAVHVELTHNGAVHTFLNRFEKDIKSDVKACDIARAFIRHNPEFFKLNNLRTELKIFLEGNGLPTRLTDEMSCWCKFVKELLKVLKDCSIKPNAGVGSIEEMRLNIDESENAHFKFYLRGRKDIPICKLKWK